MGFQIFPSLLFIEVENTALFDFYLQIDVFINSTGFIKDGFGIFFINFNCNCFPLTPPGYQILIVTV